MLKTVTFAMLMFISSLVGGEVSIEAKLGYFQPSSKHFREIYNESGIYGVDVGCQVWRTLYAWAGAGYFTTEGHTRSQHTKTKIALTPLTLGLKYFRCVTICDQIIDLYAGLGAQYTQIRIHNHSHHSPQHTQKWKLGGIVKMGAIYELNPRWFLDLFADYSFLKMSNHHTNVVLDGWIFGVGIGYQFYLGDCK